ncbi:hypothetical protein [Streptosporangium carneum]|uniref:hypothetical protein n=1 Tax=Streptosporangium carneum TaxID=47481 RepID=UPI0022F33BF5|nr:hypothetical protein [Streptosporangium carneum]
MANPVPDHMKLVWRVPCPAERVRVIEWSCECRSTVYELCLAGEQAFLRRPHHFNGARQVHETYRWPIRQGDDVWRALLCGQAR